MKRLIIATLSGVLFGFVCYGFASRSQEEFNLLFFLMLVLSRTMIGLAIGISRFPMGNWAIHGLVMGFLPNVQVMDSPAPIVKETLSLRLFV